jgi:hypothetical protein
MNSAYFELMQAREDCLQHGDEITAEALFNAAIELAKLGIKLEGKTKTQPIDYN